MYKRIEEPENKTEFNRINTCGKRGRGRGVIGSGRSEETSIYVNLYIIT